MSLLPVTAAPSPTPAASSDPVSLCRIRADAVRRNAMVLDDALADALDLLPRAKRAISAHLPRDSGGRRLPNPDPPPLDLEPIRAILDRHDLGDAISPGSPSAATVEREIVKLRAQLTATRDRAWADLSRGTPRPDYERHRLERQLGVAA